MLETQTKRRGETEREKRQGIERRGKEVLPTKMALRKKIKEKRRQGVIKGNDIT